MPSKVIDLDTILGAKRPHDSRRLLGPSATTVMVNIARDEKWANGIAQPSLGTFERVVAHSEPGCCQLHDQLRRSKQVL